MAGTNERTHWVGVDLGGTKMMAVTFDEKFNAVSRCRKKTKAQQGSETGVQRMVDLIHEALAEARVDPKHVGAIGIGAPGPLDLDRGVLLDLPNLGWSDVHLKDKMEKAFGCHTSLLNDVDAGVFGEYMFGAAKGARCALGIFPGTGIGGGCVYEGKIIRGKTSSCLELGHIQVLPDGPLCGCGLYGCLESVAGRLAIAAQASAAAFRGQAPYLLKTVGTDLSEIRSGTLADSVAAGDKAVERIVRNAARWMGVAVATAIHLLSPDIVILGGGMVEAMPGLMKDEVEKSTDEHVMQSFRKSFKIKVAQLGDDAAAVGAAAWARHMADTK